MNIEKLHLTNIEIEFSDAVAKLLHKIETIVFCWSYLSTLGPFLYVPVGQHSSEDTTKK